MGQGLYLRRRMDAREITMGLLYFAVVWTIAFVIRRMRYRDVPEGRYFLPGLGVKIIGAVALGLVYYFYYGNGGPAGDTYSYYSAGVAWVNTLEKDPETAIGFMLDPKNNIYQTKVKYNSPIQGTNYIFRGRAELLMIRITGILALLALKSYYATAILFAFLSFTGVWALYRTFLHFFPKIPRNLAIAIFFIPSVFFWGSGILKDTIVLGSLGWLTYTVFRVFLFRKITIFNLGLMLLSFWLISVLKGYVLLAFVPALGFWILATYKSRIGSAFLRTIITPFMIALSIGLSALLISQLSDMVGKYSLENLESTASATQWWHQVANPEGSIYTIDVGDFSPASLLRAAPAAIVASYFRPFPWEANGAIAYLTAIESFLILLFSLYLLFRARIFGIFRYFRHPFVQFCLIFALIFGFAVGITSFNFGALARYKIQSMPFFVAILFMIKYQMDEKKKAASDEAASIEQV